MATPLRRLTAYLLTALGLLFASPGFALAADFTADSFASVPRFSAAPTGLGREPVSFIYIGSEDQIIRLFIDHGWNGADAITPASLARAFQAARTGAPYPTAPFSPAFINGQVQDLSFQLPTAANTISQRHHTRIWLTDTVISDQPVWVGTASFDVSLATAGLTILPVHHIDPDLPTERAFILSSLGVGDAPLVQLSAAGSGNNSFGDPYFHDGLAAIVDLTTVPLDAPAGAVAVEAPPVQSQQPTTNLVVERSVTINSFSRRFRDCFTRATTIFSTQMHWRND